MCNLVILSCLQHHVTSLLCLSPSCIPTPLFYCKVVFRYNYHYLPALLVLRCLFVPILVMDICKFPPWWIHADIGYVQSVQSVLICFTIFVLHRFLFVFQVYLFPTIHTYHNSLGCFMGANLGPNHYVSKCLHVCIKIQL